MSDSPQHTNKEILGLFQSKLSELEPETVAKYRRTLSELDLFLSAHRLQLARLSETMTADWVAEMMRQGLAKSTIIRHLNILSSLAKPAVKRGWMPSCDAPRTIAKTLKETEIKTPELMNERTFGNFLSLLRAIAGKSDHHNVYENVMLFSILNGAMPLGEIAALRKEDAVKFDGESAAILERNMSPARKYIFDLRQSYLTTRQVYSSLAAGMRPMIDKCMTATDVGPDALMRSVWVMLAVRSGATASEALGCVAGDAPYSLPDFCLPVEVPARDKRLWINAVNPLILHRAPKWYAMHLRRGVRFEELRKAISEKIRPVPEFFYPYETITRQVGGRRVAEQQPVISQTAFFRTHPEDVLPMFREIGDRAWCYRVNNDPTSPYAIISPLEMRRFQAAIGTFTPNVELHPLGELTPLPGESVIVVVAGYGNREAQVEDIINRDSHTAIFRVKLFTDQGYEWRMDLDPRQVERVRRTVSL